MPYQIRKIFKFEGAHILSGAYSEECKNHIHGHSYVVEVFIKSDDLNENGMIIDFKELKEYAGTLFDQWDHALVVHKDDEREGIKFMADILTHFNPTAENMAEFFYKSLKRMFDISKVRVHETATGYAEYWEE
jgi:6-pyruvoyltetrahydropterin/6-carboxytetrahydropterin synthase